jgi:acetoin:2,6-dichlorophenolindophenol oxidoreductase subunit beta
MDSSKEHTYAEATNLALAEAMRVDPRVVLIGENVSQGGPFGTTTGLREQFGVDRVVNVPGNQAIDRALALAAEGRYPAVDLSWRDLLGAGLIAFMDYVARAARQPSDKVGMPLALRTQATPAEDGTPCPLEAWLPGMPGLRVAVPSIPSDADRLLRSAIRHDYPSVVIESHDLSEVRGPLGGTDIAPAGKVKVLRVGGDVTIVATLRLVHEALAAAEELAGQGIEMEVIDPRWLAPLDLEGILESARRTHHLVVAQEGAWPGTGGVTIAALVQEHAFPDLLVLVVRVGGESQAPGGRLGRLDIMEAVLRSRAGVH